LGIAAWVAVLKSGVDPVVVGLVMGLLAYPAARADLERANDLFRRATITGVGTIAGIGFAVSILIATLAFTGTRLQEAKLGVLTTVLAAPAVTWLVFRAAALLPARLQVHALLGTSEVITDLGAPVDPERDRIRGPAPGAWSPSSSTATSNAPTAARPNPSSGSC
jgi:Na+/H+ antiporter NhaA